ncbi:MAG TPA: glycoside hydrolase family 15 protein [Bacteroidales bacterium]
MEYLNYGAVGNGRTAALISDKGSVDWFCFPDFDSPSVFAKILDAEKGGSMRVEVGDNYTIAQNYVSHTNILSTLFDSDEGGFELIDFMPKYRIESLNDHYLPPESYRIIRLKYGKPRLKVIYDPRLNYASEAVTHKSGPEYIKTYSMVNERDSVYLYSSLKLEDILSQKEITIAHDEFILLSYNLKLIPINLDRVELEYERTKVYWMDWSNRSKKYTKYNDLIERSMLVLKLMSYQRSGAVLAALTTSIPESVGEVRNWDYRFCWIRDASMSIETLLRVGHRGAAEGFMNFIQNILLSKSDRFQIMYGIRGERVLVERELDHMSGFKNSRPVRVGNEAYVQRQNDSYGYLMDVIYQYYLYFPGTLNEIEDMFTVVRNIVRTVIEQWQQPDKGIWEIRGPEKHFVLSKVMCWVAMDRAESIARLLGKVGFAEKWLAVADTIRQDVMEHGWKEEIGSFSQTYCNTEVDASLLLMEVYGFISPEDERFKMTVNAIMKGLMHEGLLYRYRNMDDFGTPTSAFTICTFWMVRALFVTGRKEEALKLFDELITYSNHLGLFSEDLDFATKSQLGNFPQAYSHLALINTALLFADEVERSKFIKP